MVGVVVEGLEVAVVEDLEVAVVEGLEVDVAEASGEEEAAVDVDSEVGLLTAFYRCLVVLPGVKVIILLCTCRWKMI